MKMRILLLFLGLVKHGFTYKYNRWHENVGQMIGTKLGSVIVMVVGALLTNYASTESDSDSDVECEKTISECIRESKSLTYLEILPAAYGYNITDPGSEGGTNVTAKEAFNKVFSERHNLPINESGDVVINATERARLEAEGVLRPINDTITEEAIDEANRLIEEKMQALESGPEYRNCISSFTEGMFVILVTSDSCTPEQLAEAVTHYKISGYPHETGFTNMRDTISVTLQSDEMHASK